ncbi:hypothetical protein ANN_08096 [Periplaneta americana]|uniref:Uncharacterized protein n=1 Tax=Periplaneta americana TaxID=6978 RepID=A0ABQ8T2P9_PERAM|nr:hypothetical protein ANN_08096 [Periplaneta americana]
MDYVPGVTRTGFQQAQQNKTPMKANGNSGHQMGAIPKWVKELRSKSRLTRSRVTQVGAVMKEEGKTRVIFAFGFYLKGEFPRNNRHQGVRSYIASCLRDTKKYEVYEEVTCTSTTASYYKRADIVMLMVMMKYLKLDDVHDDGNNDGGCGDDEVSEYDSDNYAVKDGRGDNASEMSPGSSTESCPEFAHFGLRENPGENLNQRDEVTGEWRNLHNAELHALYEYSSPDIIRNITSRCLRWTGHVARMGESRNGNAYRVLVGRPEGPLGRPRRRWEDNIKIDLREVGYDDRDWINFAQDRDRWRAYVRVAMNIRVP